MAALVVAISVILVVLSLAAVFGVVLGDTEDGLGWLGYLLLTAASLALLWTGFRNWHRAS